MTLLNLNKDIHQNIIKKYKGKWLKDIGDGILASFSSVSKAVYCAGEIMNSCSDNKIDLRIGLHQGEVVFKENDVFGDGVNIASRLETIAPVGGICVSEAVYRLRPDLNIRNHCFKKGHSIMVQVQSTWFPLIGRNSQKFVDIPKAKAEDYQTATQRIFNSTEYPSYIKVSALQ